MDDLDAPRVGLVASVSARNWLNLQLRRLIAPSRRRRRQAWRRVHSARGLQFAERVDHFGRRTAQLTRHLCVRRSIASRLVRGERCRLWALMHGSRSGEGNQEGRSYSCSQGNQ